MAKWSVQVLGDSRTLSQLPELLGGPDREFAFEDGACWLKSGAWNEFHDVADVLQAASALLQLLNGANRLAFSPLERLSIGRAARDDIGTRKSYSLVTANATTYIALPAEVVVRELGSDGYAVLRGWLSAAFRDEQVAKVLRLLNRPEDSWDDLYRILEVVQSDAGQRIFAEGWAKKQAVTLFTRTANSTGAIGDAARHSRPQYQAPATPMAHREAVELIHRIARRWLQSKINQNVSSGAGPP